MSLATAEPPSTAVAWLAGRAGGPMPEGAVLLHAGTATFQAPGGGEVQLIQSGRHLERLGWPIRPFNPWTDRIAHARLLHLFGMSREGLALARVAQARGVPVVLSPICWFEPRALAALAPGPIAAARDVGKWLLRRACPRLPGWRRELLQAADAILPNSLVEARQLSHLFAIDPARFHVVPNGVEARFADARPDAFRSRFTVGEFVLYVGRIEPRKNVLGLIRALAGNDLPLVVAGDAVPGHEGYADACRRVGRGFTTWVGRLDHDGVLLASAYASARVLALPSWFETPGLAALEAALAGCAVVITPFGCTREYFGDHVAYARPDRPAAIADSVRRAWVDGPKAGLASHVRNRYLWSHVAERTAEVYQALGR
jgi:glycosyltransferase involved in cell wall biosynthesis